MTPARYIATTADPMPAVLDTATLLEWVRVADCDKELLDMLSLAAQQWAEGFCDNPLFARSYTVSLTGPQSGTLPGFAISEIIIEVAESNGSWTAVSEEAAGATGGTVTFSDDAPEGSYRIRYKAGWDNMDLPQDVALALLYYVAYSYDNRANPVSERATAAEGLLRKYKYYSI